MDALPFALARSGPGWTGWWAERRIRVVVAGDERAPHADHLANLARLVTAWPNVVHAIATFTRALPADALVRLETEGREREGFAASTCGFDRELRFESVVFAPDPRHAAPRPDRYRVTFYTGEPDGYATFTAHFEGDRVVDLTAFAS